MSALSDKYKVAINHVANNHVTFTDLNAEVNPNLDPENLHIDVLLDEWLDKVAVDVLETDNGEEVIVKDVLERCLELVQQNGKEKIEQILKSLKGKKKR